MGAMAGGEKRTHTRARPPMQNAEGMLFAEPEGCGCFSRCRVLPRTNAGDRPVLPLQDADVANYALDLLIRQLAFIRGHLSLAIRDAGEELAI
jgi:hypothetical protein